MTNGGGNRSRRPGGEARCRKRCTGECLLRVLYNMQRSASEQVSPRPLCPTPHRRAEASQPAESALRH